MVSAINQNILLYSWATVKGHLYWSEVKYIYDTIPRKISKLHNDDDDDV